MYLLSLPTVRERAASLSAWLFHSTPYVTVALTLQSDLSGHSQLSHFPAADSVLVTPRDTMDRSQAMPGRRASPQRDGWTCIIPQAL